jgi:hypothetical protein
VVALARGAFRTNRAKIIPIDEQGEDGIDFFDRAEGHFSPHSLVQVSPAQPDHRSLTSLTSLAHQSNNSTPKPPGVCYSLVSTHEGEGCFCVWDQILAPKSDSAPNRVCIHGLVRCAVRDEVKYPGDTGARAGEFACPS